MRVIAFFDGQNLHDSFSRDFRFLTGLNLLCIPVSRVYSSAGLSQLCLSCVASRSCIIRFMLRPATLAGIPDWVRLPLRKAVGLLSSRFNFEQYSFISNTLLRAPARSITVPFKTKPGRKPGYFIACLGFFSYACNLFLKKINLAFCQAFTHYVIIGGL
jgi:hypothetical protein